MINIIIISRDGKRHKLEAKEDETLLDLARRYDIDEIEGSCEGCMACSTCHVVIDDSWYDKIEKPSEEEKDILDFAFGLTPHSRLGCQIKITSDLDGLTVWLPAGVNNMLLS